MIQLTYTNEMKEQDLLWETEEENFDTMKNLYDQIIKEAKAKGFNGEYLIYENNEAIIEIYKDKIEQEKCDNGSMEVNGLFGFCKPLIKHLEEILNNDFQEYVFYNPETNRFLIDDEQQMESKNLQQAMIAVGKNVVDSIHANIPKYVVKAIIRPNKEVPSHIDLADKTIRKHWFDSNTKGAITNV